MHFVKCWKTLFVLLLMTSCSAFFAALPAEAETKLVASDGSSNDSFGCSVSLADGFVLVGAAFDNDNGEGSGSAYIFEQRYDGHWVEVDKLLASDGDSDDWFGTSVSLDGLYALVGAYGDDDKGYASGAAYVFERQGDGSWTEADKLVAADGYNTDWFGKSVSISGQRALVGARNDDDDGSSSGSAYIFERQLDGSWGEVVKLKADDGAEHDFFGCSVSFSGDYALIGAFGDGDDIDPDVDSGSAYIFELQGDGSWVEAAKLIPADSEPFDYFGEAVSLSGDYAIVGAGRKDEFGPDSGAAYIFERQGDGSWPEVAKLVPADSADFDSFGHSVSISGSYAMVGNFPGNGAASSPMYLFGRQDDGSWREIDKLTAVNGETDDGYGWDISLHGDHVLLGAKQDDANGDDAGAAYYRYYRKPTLREGFESGDLQTLPWMLSGDGQWQVNSSYPKSGQYAVQAPPLDDDQAASLELRLKCAEGEISFSFASESQMMADGLNFFIDGTKKSGWSGFFTEYYDVSYPVSEGWHTFTWEYAKNSSDSSGADTAWVDDICLRLLPRMDSIIDFNSDGKHDIALFDPVNHKWYIKDQSTPTYGTVDCLPVPGDYDGDGVTDLAVVDLTRPDGWAKWYLDGVGVFIYGLKEWIPVPGDYDGDGTTDAALFDPDTGKWYVKNQSTTVYGAGGIPVPGDYDGDGDTDIAVFYPATNKWYIKDVATYTYGMAGCIPVPADYDGGGITDLAVIDTSRPDGMAKWYIRNQAVFIYGSVADTIPVPGDYDGDGDADPCLFYQDCGKWYCRNIGICSYGNGEMIPLVSNLTTRYAISQAGGGCAVW